MNHNSTISFSLSKLNTFKTFFLVGSLILNLNSFAQEDFFNPSPLNSELPPWMNESSHSTSNKSLSWSDYNFSNRNGTEITYNWLYNFDGQITEMSLSLDFVRGWKYMQDVYKNKEHGESKFYKRFVDDDPFVVDGKVIARSLEKLGANYDYDNAKVALSFVQSLPHDPNIGSYQRYAIECLIDRKGDCSDKSVLLMAILAYMGYETIALEYPTHLAVGISDHNKKISYEGQRYKYNGFYFYYADANAVGVDVGDKYVKTKFSNRPATINRGYIKESSINGQSYYNDCVRCGGDGTTHEGHEAGPLYCIKCNGRGKY